MGLSNESQAQAAASRERQILEAQARGTAKALAQAMVLHERNPDPMREREAPNPAHGVHIRILRPMIPVPFHVEVTEAVKRHNLAVSELRKP